MSKKNIGIIGKGFVGSAVQNGFTSDKNFLANIRIYDKDDGLKTHSLGDTINKSEIIFLSVPTPSRRDGSIDLSIVDSILSEINDCQESQSIILLRSTIVPGSSNEFQMKYPKLNIVFNPEFLTEKNANFDFLNQSRIILGGDKKNTMKVASLYNWRFKNMIPIIQTDFATAELIKYMNNCFLATKVSFMNEMKIASKISGADWDSAVKGFSLDERVGNSHNNVPGHDGKFGFGGSCFPKDVQAFIHFCEQNEIPANVLIGTWKTNLRVRPEKDWEKLLGRAISED